MFSDLAAHFSRFDAEIYRLVEGQHFIATRKLVDSDDDQQILEQILDRSKPAFPEANKRGRLHYLLFTPFRYPPLRGGGRFHTEFEQSIFYGALTLETAMAEIAYGRFLFMAHSKAVFAPMNVAYTHFMAKVASERALYLTRPPFDDARADISHPADYQYAQRLGRAMREAETELFCYYSARQADGINVGLFSVDAFAQNTPIAGKEGQWSVFVTGDKIEFRSTRLTGNRPQSRIFNREAFFSANLGA